MKLNTIYCDETLFKVNKIDYLWIILNMGYEISML